MTTTVRNNARTAPAHDTAGRVGHLRATRAQRTRDLFASAADCASEDQRHALMATVIEMHLEIAYGQAARYRSRGVDLEDLRQVAAVGLTKATRGYDVSTGHDFLSYAMPTIRGELRRHFRDKAWIIRPPRRIQNLQARISAAGADLTQTLGRPPQPNEIAEHLQEHPEDVMEAMATSGCFEATSLDRPAGAEGAMSIGDLLSSDTLDFPAAEARLILNRVLGALDERDRHIVQMRFLDDLTQAEIGSRLGISQMQVSRVTARILNRLRNAIGEPTTR